MLGDVARPAGRLASAHPASTFLHPRRPLAANASWRSAIRLRGTVCIGGSLPYGLSPGLLLRLARSQSLSAGTTAASQASALANDGRAKSVGASVSAPMSSSYTIA